MVVSVQAGEATCVQQALRLHTEVHDICLVRVCLRFDKVIRANKVLRVIRY